MPSAVAVESCLTYFRDRLRIPWVCRVVGPSQIGVEPWRGSHPDFAGRVRGGSGWSYGVATIVSPCHLFVD